MSFQSLELKLYKNLKNSLHALRLNIENDENMTTVMMPKK